MRHPNPSCFAAAAVATACLITTHAFAQPAPQIDFVHMGGSDCPPCVFWRANELPKLQAMPEFKGVRFTHVEKSIPSPVPSAFWFPAEVKHLQPALYEASNGRAGSPQQAILVNGVVVDYWYGAGSSGKERAESLRAMFAALQKGEPLPRETCQRIETLRSCAKPGPPLGAPGPIARSGG